MKPENSLALLFAPLKVFKLALFLCSFFVAAYSMATDVYVYNYVSNGQNYADVFTACTDLVASFQNNKFTGGHVQEETQFTTQRHLQYLCIGDFNGAPSNAGEIPGDKVLCTPNSPYPGCNKCPEGTVKNPAGKCVVPGRDGCDYGQHADRSGGSSQCVYDCDAAHVEIADGVCAPKVVCPSYQTQNAFGICGPDPKNPAPPSPPPDKGCPSGTHNTGGTCAPNNPPQRDPCPSGTHNISGSASAPNCTSDSPSPPSLPSPPVVKTETSNTANPDGTTTVTSTTTTTTTNVTTGSQTTDTNVTKFVKGADGTVVPNSQTQSSTTATTSGGGSGGLGDGEKKQGNCGAPGQPKCSINEEGTETDITSVSKEYDAAKKSADDAASTAAKVASEPHDTSLGFSLYMPQAACTPFSLPNGMGSIDPCPAVDLMKQAIDYAMILGTIFLIMGMVKKAIDGA